MLFFRSEEDLDQWLSERQAECGAVFSISQLWELSQLWYYNRLSPDYHGRTMEQVQDIFRKVGLTTEYWQSV